MVNKILVIIGTRPEAIKMAPVIIQLRKQFKVKLCLTGQHDKLLQESVKIFNLKADYDLKIMKQNQSLFDISIKILKKINLVIDDTNPDLILVHGDTTTSTMSALAGFYRNIKIGHVEAGLRTNDIYSPYPEELNRQITARLSNIHFAPSKIAKQNLIKENISDEKIFITGNSIVDAFNIILKKLKKVDFPKEIKKKIPLIGSKQYKSKLILVTCHRRENFGIGINQICKALLDISKSSKEVDIVFIMHPNPNVKKDVQKLISNKKNIHLVQPQNYLSFIKIMSQSDLIITDSGGIQEEAPSIGTPVLIIRKLTERPEGLKSGILKIVGNDRKNIVREAEKILNKKIKFKIKNNPYGDGNASKKIVKVINFLNK